MLRKLVRSGAAWFTRSAKLKAAAYYGGSSLICQAFRFTGLLASTRLISAGQFGVFATALMVVGVCGLLRDFGQNSALLSRCDPLAGYSKLHFQLTVSLGLLTSVAVITVCYLLPHLAGLRPLLPLLVVTLMAEAIQQTPQVLAQRAFRFRELAVIELTATGTWLTAILVGAFTFPNVMTLVAARTLETLVRGGTLFYWRRTDLFQGQITPVVWKYFGRFARFLGPQAWLENAFSNLDVLLLRQFVGDVELGVYDRTQQLLRIPLSLSINLVDRVAGAAYSRDQAAPQLLRRSILQFSVLIITGTLAGLAVLQAFLTIFAGPVLGSGWANAIKKLLPWALPFCLLRPLVWNFNIF